MSVSDSQSYISLPVQIAAHTIPLTKIAVGTQGDVLYFNGTDWVALSVGISGYFLKTQGAGANPIWASAASKLAICFGGSASGAAIAAGAEQTVCTVTPALFSANKYAISLSIYAVTGFGGCAWRVYKGANILVESDAFGANTAYFYDAYYDAAAWKTQRGYQISGDGLLNGTFTARDLTAAGNLVLKIYNPTGGSISPASTNQCNVSITEGSL